MQKREYSFSTFLTIYLGSILGALISILLIWIFFSTNRSLKQQQDLTIQLNNRNSALVLDTLRDELIESLHESSSLFSTQPEWNSSNSISSFKQLFQQETLADIDLLRFVPTEDTPEINADSPFFDFSRLELHYSTISQQMLERCQLLSAPAGNVTLFLIAASHRVVHPANGRVLGYLVGGIVINNNLPLIRKLLSRSNAEILVLQSGKEILTTSTPLSTRLSELLIRNNAPIVRTKSILSKERERLIISGHDYAVGNAPVTIRMIYKDALFKELQNTFIASGLLILIAATLIFKTLYGFSKKQVRHAIHELVNYTTKVVDTPDAARFTPSRFSEFNHIGRAIEKMVSKLEEAHRELKQTKERLELVIDGADLGSWDWDIENDIAVFNNRWGNMLGYAPQELQPSAEMWVNLIHPEDKESVLEALDQHLKGRNAFYIIEHRLQHKDGHWIWVLTAGKVIHRNSEGQPLRAAGIHLDISRQKAAEEAFLRERALLISMINSIPDLIYYKDQNSVYLGCNKAFEKFMERPTDQIIGKSDFDLFNPQTAKAYRREDKLLIESGKSQRSEISVMFPDGHRELLDMLRTPLLGPDQGTIGVIGISRDITALKEAEQKLADETERLVVTLRSIGDGVITTDTSGAVVLLNKSAEQLTGWSSDEAEGLPARKIFHIVHEQNGLPAENPAEIVIATGQIVSLQPDTILISKDGSRRKIADSGAPIHDRQGNIIGSVIVFRDITNQQKMESEAMKARKLESIGVLAGGIAHDFNNILTAILGNLDLTSTLIPESEEKVHALLSNARKATTRATKLTQQLLTFSKGGEPVREATPLPKLIEDSADFVLHGSKVECTYDFQEDLWLADADTGQISQVIQNITLNAKHAMPGGGTIKVSATNVIDPSKEPILDPAKGPYIKITISDTGTGILDKHLDRIFDPYFTTKQEGSGLGLAISHSIIKKHGGHLTVESRSGKGTIFCIYIPKANDPITQTPDFQAGDISTQSLRVLVMDDEEMIRAITGEQLRSIGHMPIFAENGEQALGIYKRFHNSTTPVDVVILDLTIRGGMGGLEASEKILRLDPNARIIVASGYSNDPVMSRYLDYGMQAAMVKPFDMASLKKALHVASR